MKTEHVRELTKELIKVVDTLETILNEHHDSPLNPMQSATYGSALLARTVLGTLKNIVTKATPPTESNEWDMIAIILSTVAKAHNEITITEAPLRERVEGIAATIDENQLAAESEYQNVTKH